MGSAVSGLFIYLWAIHVLSGLLELDRIMEENYEVIVIGAGMSGIGASQILAEKKIGHVILEGRGRVGGRVAEGQFEGVKVDLGASFVHSPKAQNHSIDKYIRQAEIEVVSAQYSQCTFLYENQGVLSQKHIDKAWQMYDKFQQFAKEVASTGKEKSVSEVFQQFCNAKLAKKDEHVRNMVRWEVEVYANVEGAALDQLTIREFVENQCETTQDYLPVQGYWGVLQSILSTFHPKVLLSQIVTEIDYQQQLVAVRTSKGDVFHCKKLVSSLPLGVLQQGKVKFNPPLPLSYAEAIQNMGNGVANKLFVSLDKPFWAKKAVWLNFVAKTTNNRYPVAMVLPAKQKHIICVFVSGQASIEISQWSNEAVASDFAQFLAKFTKHQVAIKAIELTRWQLDEFSLGSYSFCKGRTSLEQSIATLKVPLDNKIWFVGEHMNKGLNACAHSAYETGIEAGLQISELLEPTTNT